MLEGDLQSVLELLDVRPAVCVADTRARCWTGLG